MSWPSIPVDSTEFAEFAEYYYNSCCGLPLCGAFAVLSNSVLDKLVLLRFVYGGFASLD